MKSILGMVAVLLGIVVSLAVIAFIAGPPKTAEFMLDDATRSQRTSGKRNQGGRPVVPQHVTLMNLWESFQGFVDADPDLTLCSVEYTNGWALEVHPTDAWHQKSRSRRQADAERWLAAWIEMASPDRPEFAAVWIVDRHGNKVGGPDGAVGIRVRE